MLIFTPQNEGGRGKGWGDRMTARYKSTQLNPSEGRSQQNHVAKPKPLSCSGGGGPREQKKPTQSSKKKPFAASPELSL